MGGSIWAKAAKAVLILALFEYAYDWMKDKIPRGTGNPVIYYLLKAGRFIMGIWLWSSGLISIPNFSLSSLSPTAAQALAS